MFRTHWMNIIKRLQLDNGQVEALLTARTKALEQLRVIYEVRTTVAVVLLTQCVLPLYLQVCQSELQQDLCCCSLLSVSR